VSYQIDPCKQNNIIILYYSSSYTSFLENVLGVVVITRISWDIDSNFELLFLFSIVYGKYYVIRIVM